MKVLSLFDGISCGKVALERANIKVNHYVACEIDKYAIQVSKANHSDIEYIGDVTKLTFQPEYFNMLIGGSPCQGFSFAGKGLNFEDSRSKLFFEYVRILNEVKPKHFLLENVVMKQQFQDVISGYLGVQSIKINSSLVSAQNRERLYWTNIPNVTQPKDEGIKWSDVCEDGWFAGSMRGRRIGIDGKRDDYNNDIKSIQHIESRFDDKTNCLTTVGKDNICSKTKEQRTPANLVEYRYLTQFELERLQTLPKGYTSAVSYAQANRCIGNSWTVDVIAHIFKHAC